MTEEIRFTSEIKVSTVHLMGGDYSVIAAAKVLESSADAINACRSHCAIHSSVATSLEVSNNCPSCQEMAKTAKGSERLINYLMEHRHGTPFEHSAMTFYVHAPIFVFREWHRHRVGFSYNESSARYRTLEPLFWIPRLERKMTPAASSKPARPQFMAGTVQQYENLIEQLKNSYTNSYKAYKWMLDDGIATEVARAVMPVGVYSHCHVTCNPRSLMHFLALRTHDPEASFVSYPQAEIEEAALA